MKIEWLQKRVAYIDGLKNATDSQKLLSILFKKAQRTNIEERQMTVLAKAEQAAENLAKARGAASKMLNDEKRKIAQAERKARDHELYQAAGLMSLAGLLDKTTGKPTIDRGALLGALMAIAKIPRDDQRLAEFKRQGDAVLVKDAMTKAIDQQQPPAKAA